MKRTIASVLLSVFALTVFCACADKEPLGDSSATTATENNSTITTTSEVESEIKTESKESSSKKEDNSSQKPTSSKVSVTRPGSSSESSSVKISVSDRMDVVMCGFAPTTCDYYGTDRESALREMEDVIAMGYVNALSLNPSHMRHADIWELAVKYDLSIWCSA